MANRYTTPRLILAIISTSFEELAIYVIWRWLLPEFDIHFPLAVLIGVMVAWAAFGVWLFIFTTRTLKKQTMVGLPSMVGSVGKVASRLAPEGLVRIRSELWGAVSDEGDIESGEEVLVTKEDGLKLFVRRVGDTGTKR
jgi:membrane-bound ClpP family serine protease